MKALKVQIKRRPLLSFFLVFCFAVSSLVVSILSSVINEEKTKLNEGNFGYGYSSVKDFAVMFNKLEYKDIEKVSKDLAKDYHVIIRASFTDSNEEIKSIKLIKTNNEKEIKMPIVKGTALKGNKKNSLYIGKTLWNKYGKNEELNILGGDYHIEAVIGREEQPTLFDHSIITFCENIDDKAKENINKTEKEIGVYLITIIKNGNIDDNDIVRFKNAFKDINNIKIQEQFENEVFKSSITKSLVDKKRDIFGEKMLIMIAIANVVIVSTFWINERKKEIAIRKAFGAKNSHIVKLLYSELAVLSIIASLLAVGIQFVLLTTYKKIFSTSLDISFINILSLVGMAFILSIISSIIPVYRALKVEVVQCLKG